MSQENVESARRGFDAWNRGDIDAWLATYHPEAEWVSAIARQVEGVDSAWRGRAELRRFWDEWHSVWDMNIEISEYRDLGETVVALGRIHTRGKASGVDLDGPVAYVAEYENGLVRKLRAYLDPNQALEAVGLSE